jgi:hypothetical protein
MAQVVREAVRRARRSAHSGSLLSIEQFADETGIGIRLAYTGVQKNQIPNLTIGRRRFIPRSFLDQLTAQKSDAT